jgi:hypothetical protein
VENSASLPPIRARSSSIHWVGVSMSIDSKKPGVLLRAILYFVLYSGVTEKPWEFLGF